jgi:PST family polysaccharide transporter
VSFAGFSRLADSSPAEFASGFIRAFTLVIAAAVPICVVLGVLAGPIIVFVYGDQWAAAAVPLQFLVALGLLRTAVELAYDCLATRVRKTLMLMQAWWLGTLIPILLLGAHLWDVPGVAAGHVLVAGLLVSPVFVVVLGRLGIPAGRILRACVRPALGGLAMGVAAWAVHRWLGGGFVGLAVAGLASFAAYVPFVLPIVQQLRSGAAVADDVPTGEPALAGTAADPT